MRFVRLVRVHGQVLYGLAVSGDGATPIFGRVSSGNRAEPLELRFMLEQVRKALPDPCDSIFVGDSKLAGSCQ